MIPKLYNGHDKSFFFFNFEQFRETQVIADGLQTVPTLAYRQGNFSTATINPLTIAGQPAIDSLGRTLVQNQIFDPTTTQLLAEQSVDAATGHVDSWTSYRESTLVAAVPPA